jgi:hypothetical protein
MANPIPSGGLQQTAGEDAPWEFEYIEMYDPSVLQSTTPQLMPFVRGLHYKITPYLSGHLGNALIASTAESAVGNTRKTTQSLSVLASLFDDAGEGTLLQVDQIGEADFYAEATYDYDTGGANISTRAITIHSAPESVTLQAGWLPSPCLTLAFLASLGVAADATTFPAGLISVQGFLEVEWRNVGPERLKMQALARVFEKGG